MMAIFVALGLFFVFTVNDSPAGVDQPEAAWVGAGTIGIVASVVLAGRAWRAGAVVVGNSLVVRNLFRTYRMQRPVISGFAIVPAKVLGYPRTVVNRTDGEIVAITTLSPPQRRPNHPAVEKALAGLEAWLGEDPSGARDPE